MTILLWSRERLFNVATPGRLWRRTGPAASEDGKGKPTAKGWGRSKGPGRKADRVGRRSLTSGAGSAGHGSTRSGPRVTAPYPVLPLLGGGGAQAEGPHQKYWFMRGFRAEWTRPFAKNEAGRNRPFRPVRLKSIVYQAPILQVSAWSSRKCVTHRPTAFSGPKQAILACFGLFQPMLSRTGHLILEPKK